MVQHRGKSAWQWLVGSANLDVPIAVKHAANALKLDM